MESIQPKPNLVRLRPLESCPSLPIRHSSSSSRRRSDGAGPIGRRREHRGSALLTRIKSTIAVVSKTKHQKRTLTKLTFLIFLSCALISITIPFLLFRHLFNMKIICFNSNLQNPNQHCTDTAIIIGQISYRLFEGLAYALLGPIFAYLSLNPKCETKNTTIAKIAFLSFIYIIPIIVLTIWLPDIVSLILIAVPMFAGVATGPLLDRSGYNVGGVKFAILVAIMQVLCIRGASLVASGVNNEFAFGLSYGVFLPLFIQVVEGLVITAAERFSKSCSLTAFNYEVFVMVCKYLMMLVSTLKFVLLLGALDHRDFYVIAAINIVAGAVGRIQIWRYVIRKIRGFITGKPMSKRLKVLSGIILCSEIDMEYLPWFLLLFINVVQSPLQNSGYGIYHVKNEYMDLRDDSRLAQSIWNLFLLFLVIFCGDLLTILLYKKISFCRLFRIKFTFITNKKIGGFCGAAFIWLIVQPLLGFGHFVAI